MMKETDDKFLLDLFLNGNDSNYAFNLIVRKYQERLYWHVRRLVIDHDDSNDIIQNTWIKVFQNLNSFRADSKLYTWLYRIATNEALAFLNKKRKVFFIAWNDVEEQLSNSLVADELFSGNEIQAKFQKAILKLPEKQRVVFNMKYFDELTYEDISDVLKTSVGALKASYHHAVKKIEKYMTED